jgi:hypothetical protein
MKAKLIDERMNSDLEKIWMRERKGGGEEDSDDR